MAYKAIVEYGLNQIIGPVSISTLSNGGMDESGGSAPWGRDQVLYFIILFLLHNILLYADFNLNTTGTSC